MDRILGIDLGTTNSSCAVMDGQQPVLVPNARGNRSTPSVVAFTEKGDVLVGESARNQCLVHPDATIRNVKRSIGNPVPLACNGRSISAPEAASYILKQLKADAEAWQGEVYSDALITVPAYFSESQRRATRLAGELAGLNVRRLLNEPSAAALAWAWQVRMRSGSDQREQLVLVYDFGGGTFDVTVLRMRGDDCMVLATCGDTSLGGLDFDYLLAQHLLSKLPRPPCRMLEQADPLLQTQLLDAAERAKQELSLRTSTQVVLPFLGRGFHASTSITIGRAELEKHIYPHIERTMKLVETSLQEAAVSADQIDQLVLSGGSSRIPLVHELLRKRFGLSASPRLHPEELVASGAAVYAQSMQEEEHEFHVQDALSRSFGLEIGEGNSMVLIPKNSPFPIQRKRLFTTVADNQSSVEIHILQGDATSAASNESLGRFLLTDIRRGRRGEPRIEVELSVDEDEILTVSARDVDTGAVQNVVLAGSPAEGPLPDRLRLESLSRRVRALAGAAEGDRSLLLEIENTLTRAQRLMSGPSEDSAETAGMDAVSMLCSELEVLIAELSARAR